MRSEYLRLPAEVEQSADVSTRLRDKRQHTLQLEGEIVGQVAALVIAAEEEESIRVPYFQ